MWTLLFNEQLNPSSEGRRNLLILTSLLWPKSVPENKFLAHWLPRIVEDSPKKENTYLLQKDKFIDNRWKKGFFLWAIPRQ